MTDQQPQPSRPLPEDELQLLEPEEQSTTEVNRPNLSQIWSRLVRFGIGESALRISTAAAALVLVVLVVWVMSKYFLNAEKNTATPAAIPTEEVSNAIPELNESINVANTGSISIFRLAQIHTILPPKPRYDVIEYTIETGDTLFGIADKFGLKPESVLWSNKHILGDNPHNLFPGVTILIPPIDGAIYQWNSGDGLNGVSEFYNVTPDVIVDWPTNRLNRETLGDFSLPNIQPGTLLFVPNGYGEFTDWLPQFTRENAAVAATLGPGWCGAITEGPIGNGTFVWPTTETYLSGFDYSPATNHKGIDIAGATGNPIFAVDAGVVVYSGWNNNGYGNLLIIDHGNGWQSVYAHLESIYKNCGDYVETQGEQVAELGNTGNSTGPHLHFELRNSTYGTVNPWDFLQY